MPKEAKIIKRKEEAMKINSHKSMLLEALERITIRNSYGEDEESVRIGLNAIREVYFSKDHVNIIKFALAFILGFIFGGN